MTNPLKQKIFVAGHSGMVGSAIVRKLRSRGFRNLVTCTHDVLDLTRQVETEAFFKAEKIDLVYLAAAKVGGIQFNNTFPADFIYQNLMMACNVIHSAHRAGVQQLMFLGSSCIYPKYAPQPMIEQYLASGGLEPSNAPYAMGKLAGISMCESYNRQHGRDYRVVIPASLYGPHDCFHIEKSHVIPALMLRFQQAVQHHTDVTLWGTGTALREFLHVDDMADATVLLAELDPTIFRSLSPAPAVHVNIGTGQECSIQQLAERIAECSGFKGRILFDSSRPDGTPRKVLDTRILASLGWTARIPLAEGLSKMYHWFLKNQAHLRS